MKAHASHVLAVGGEGGSLQPLVDRAEETAPHVPGVDPIVKTFSLQLFLSVFPHILHVEKIWNFALKDHQESSEIAIGNRYIQLFFSGFSSSCC